MINVTWKAKGVFAVRQGKAAPLLSQASSQSLQAAMVEWATGRGRTFATLADRMKPTAFSVYGFARRTVKYRKKQQRVLGQVRPYYSPRGIDLSGLIIAAARGNGNALLAAAARIQRSEHMANLVTRPGGFTLQSRTSGRRATVSIRYPGAKALNIGGAKSLKYRQEFTDWQMGGGRDANAVMARAQEIFSVEFKRGLDAIPTRRIS